MSCGGKKQKYPGLEPRRAVYKVAAMTGLVGIEMEIQMKKKKKGKKCSRWKQCIKERETEGGLDLVVRAGREFDLVNSRLHKSMHYSVQLYSMRKQVSSNILSWASTFLLAWFVAVRLQTSKQDRLRNQNWC